MSKYAAIEKLKHGVNRRLRMHQDFHLRRRQVKEPARFDHFEALIHQRGRVNSDALPHLPCGMIERLLDSDGTEFRPGRIQKRSARSGQPDAFDFFHAPAPQALVDRGVFAVDWKQWLSLAARLCCNELAGCDQALLIGYADGFSSFHRFVGGLKSGNTNDGADQEVDIWVSR